MHFKHQHERQRKEGATTTQVPTVLHRHNPQGTSTTQVPTVLHRHKPQGTSTTQVPTGLCRQKMLQSQRQEVSPDHHLAGINKGVFPCFVAFTLVLLKFTACFSGLMPRGKMIEEMWKKKFPIF